MKIRVKAFASLKILSEYGNNLREPYSKYIDKWIFELRIKFSTDITRIFYNVGKIFDFSYITTKVH